MSTRGFLGFVVDGAEKIAYNQFDSYPDGLGREVLGWLRAADLDAAREAARTLRVVTPEESARKPTPEDVARYGRWMRRRNARLGDDLSQPEDWYDLLYETHGSLSRILEAGAIEDGAEFPLDSLFAEWGYVVDFDAGNLEAFRGFQHAPHEHGRFAKRGPYVPPHRSSAEYWPVALVQTWSLKDLPGDDEFVAILEPPDEG